MILNFIKAFVFLFYIKSHYLLSSFVVACVIYIECRNIHLLQASIPVAARQASFNLQRNNKHIEIRIRQSERTSKTLFRSDDVIQITALTLL